jgi:hypothetical protein
MKLHALTLIAAVSIATSIQAQTPPGGPPPSPEMRAAHAAVMKTCEADIRNLCADKQGREAMHCLRSNSDKLSAGCADALSKLPRPPHPPQ